MPFDSLVGSVDDAKAKPYLEAALGTELPVFIYKLRLVTVLKEFLMSGGKGEKIPKIEAAMDDDEAPQMLLAAEDESTDA